MPLYLLGGYRGMLLTPRDMFNVGVPFVALPLRTATQ